MSTRRAVGDRPDVRRRAVGSEVVHRALAGSGWLLVVASVLVLAAAGWHTSQLGPDPAWQFDCNDTGCDDLWAEPRRYYRVLSAAALATGTLGWLLIGISRPRRVPRGGRRLAVPATTLVLALDVIVPPAALFALGVSLPTSLAVVSVGSAAVAGSLWARLRGSGRDRAAWFAATAVTLGGLLAWVVASLALFGLVWVIAPLLAAPALPVAHLVGAHLAHRALAGDAPQGDPAPGTDGQETSGAARPGDPQAGGAVRGLLPVLTVGLVGIVVMILTLAALSLVAVP